MATTMINWTNFDMFPDILGGLGNEVMKTYSHRSKTKLSVSDSTPSYLDIDTHRDMFIGHGYLPASVNGNSGAGVGNPAYGAVNPIDDAISPVMMETHHDPITPPTEDGFYDMSNFSYPLPIKVVAQWEAVLKVGFLVVIMSLAILGNLAVIVTVWKKKRLHTTTNYYIVNLAVSDLLVTGSCTWVQVVNGLTDGWQLGAFFCKFNSFAQVLSLVSSILTLTLISCDRFFGIMFAIRAHLVERRAYVFIILVWILSISVSTPILVYRKQYIRHWADHTEIWCEDNWPYSKDVVSTPLGNRTIVSFPAKRTYYTLVSLVLFFIPIAVMSMAYLLIIYKLWSRMPPGEVMDCDVSAQVRVKRKVILMLMTILSVFAVCWLPLQVSILYSEHRPDVNESELPPWYEDFNYFATFLAYCNSAINPIIYTCFNESYRKAFKEIFLCKRSRRLQLSDQRYSYSYNTIELRVSQYPYDQTTEITLRSSRSSPSGSKKSYIPFSV